MNPQHPCGKHKAWVFATALGFTAENANESGLVIAIC